MKRANVMGFGVALNLLAAVMVPVGYAFVAAADALAVMSTYRELDANGVIDHAKLRTYDGGRFAADPWAVPDFINRSRPSALPLAVATSVLFLANAAAFVVLWRRSGPRATDATPRP